MQKAEKVDLLLGHRNSLHLKVSLGGAQGARTNFFQLDCQKLDRLI